MGGKETGTTKYDIRIELKPGIRVVGQALRTSNADNAKHNIVPRLMFDFMATRVMDVKNRTDERSFYGILDMAGESEGSDSFRWIAGVEVDRLDDVPEDLIGAEYPASLYAVVTCKGIPPYSLYMHFEREWLPASGYERAAPYSYQFHGPRFRGSLHPDSEVDVCFPIRPREGARQPAAASQAESGWPDTDSAAQVPAPNADSSERSSDVPELLYDGGDIDALWDNHEEAIAWYERHMGLRVKQKEAWKPDPRADQGKMTHLGHGLWLESVVTRTRLPFHYAERGTVDPNVRWCWKTYDAAQAHAGFVGKGVRVSELYRGADGIECFDVWATSEGTLLTIHEDRAMEDGAFADSFVRIGVTDPERAADWYERFVGMKRVSVHPAQGYAVMTLGVNHHPGERFVWKLEKLPDASLAGRVDGAVRPRCFIAEREALFAYHRFLRDSGIVAGDIGGFVQRGYVKFHFYDPDGNRFNVCSF